MGIATDCVNTRSFKENSFEKSTKDPKDNEIVLRGFSDTKETSIIDFFLLDITGDDTRVIEISLVSIFPIESSFSIGVIASSFCNQFFY